MKNHTRQLFVLIRPCQLCQEEVHDVEEGEDGKEGRASKNNLETLKSLHRVTQSNALGGAVLSFK